MNYIRFKTIFICLVLIFCSLYPLMAFDNTNILVEEAVNHIYQQRYKQAYQTLKKAYEQSPRHPGVHFNLGRLFEMTGNFQEALKEYRIAASLDTSMVAARRGLARCVVELKRKRLIEQSKTGDVNAKPAPIVRMTNNKPAPPRTIVVRQNPAINETSKKHVPVHDTKIEFSEPKLPPLPMKVVAKAYTNSGESKAAAILESGKTEKAIKILDKILVNNPDSPTGHFLMGKALYIKGDLFGSIKHLEEALRVDRNYYDAYYLLGKDYSKVNLLDDAIKNYKMYYAVKPQSKVAIEMARLYEKMNKPIMAKEYYERANSSNPGNVSIQKNLLESRGRVATELYLRANYAYSIKDYKNAAVLFGQALKQSKLQGVYRNDAIRKLSFSEKKLGDIKRMQAPIKRGFAKSREVYGTVDLKYYQLADISNKTKFTGPITVEWRGYIAKRFTRYGRDFLLMIKELSQDELDYMKRDRNSYRLNSHYNNQPVFLITAPKHSLPEFMKEGTMVTFTGKTDWKFYSIINDLGQTMKLPAFEFISAFSG